MSLQTLLLLSLARMNRLLSPVFLLAFYLAQANHYQLFEENGKTGMKDQSGKVIIPARYEALGWSNGSFSVIQGSTGYKVSNRWGLIHISNRIITPAEFVELLPAENDLLLAARQNQVTLQITRGCLTPSGKIILPFVYAGIRIHGLRAITYSVHADNQLRYGLTDLRHRTILPASYAHIYPLGNLRFAVQNTHGKIALFTENGQALTDFVIDSIAVFHADRAVFYQNGRQGLINRNGEIIVPAKYRKITWNGTAWTGHLPDKWYVITPQNQTEHQTEADSIMALPDGNLALLLPNQVQLTDNRMQPLHQPFAATGIHKVISNNLLIFRAGNRFGVIRTDGLVILPAVFSSVTPAHGLLLAQTQTMGRKQWCLYDLLGRRVSNTYDYIEPIPGEFFRVGKNRNEGLLNNSGAEILPCVYERILECKHDQASVQFLNQYGIVTLQDKWLVTPQPNPLKLLGPHTYLEREGNITWLKNFSGTALYFTTNPVTQQGDQLIEETSSGGRWTISMEGRIVNREMPATQQAEWTGPSSEGYRPVRRNGRYGFINEDGLLMIPNRYEDVMPFSEDRAGIKIRNKWGFIDHTDRIVVQPVYDKALPFTNGLSKVSQKNKWGMIDREGKIVVQVRYDSVQVLTSGRVLIQADGYFGLADLDGHILLHTKYDEITDLNNDMVIVKQNGKYGVVDVRGVAVIPLNYDYLFYHPSAQRFLGCLKGSRERL
jgi:hypothetical protein